MSIKVDDFDNKLPTGRVDLYDTKPFEVHKGSRKTPLPRLNPTTTSGNVLIEGVKILAKGTAILIGGALMLAGIVTSLATALGGVAGFFLMCLQEYTTGVPLFIGGALGAVVGFCIAKAGSKLIELGVGKFNEEDKKSVDSFLNICLLFWKYDRKEDPTDDSKKEEMLSS